MEKKKKKKIIFVVGISVAILILVLNLIGLAYFKKGEKYWELAKSLPSFSEEAELLRDQALAIGDLFVCELGHMKKSQGEKTKKQKYSRTILNIILSIQKERADSGRLPQGNFYGSVVRPVWENCRIG
ncbi:MAG: hypothetical protein ACOX7K_09750 [Oscillospiraceae bacterium]